MGLVMFLVFQLMTLYFGRKADIILHDHQFLEPWQGDFRVRHGRGVRLPQNVSISANTHRMDKDGCEEFMKIVYKFDSPTDEELNQQHLQPEPIAATFLDMIERGFTDDDGRVWSKIKTLTGVAKLPLNAMQHIFEIHAITVVTNIRLHIGERVETSSNPLINDVVERLSMDNRANEIWNSGRRK
ncbi:hypothetical protein HDU76_009367, partial [Blyttiomyces sp. JEL0837]